MCPCTASFFVDPAVDDAVCVQVLHAGGAPPVPFLEGTGRPRSRTRFVSCSLVTRSVTISRRFACRLVCRVLPNPLVFTHPFGLRNAPLRVSSRLYVHRLLFGDAFEASDRDWSVTPLFFVEPCPGPFPVLDSSRFFLDVFAAVAVELPALRATRFPDRLRSSVLVLSSGVAFSPSSDETITKIRDQRRTSSIDFLLAGSPPPNTSHPPVFHR